MLNKWSVAYHLEDVCSQPLCSLSNLFHFYCHNSVHSLLEYFGRKNVKCYTKYFAEETHSACWIRVVSPKRRQALFSVGVCLLECMHTAFLWGMCAFVYTTQSSFSFLGLAQFVLLEPCVHIHGSVPTWRPQIYVHQASFATWRNNGEKQWVNYCSGNPPPWVGSGALSLKVISVLPNRSVMACEQSWSRMTASWPRRSTRPSWTGACGKLRRWCRSCTLITPSWR